MNNATAISRHTCDDDDAYQSESSNKVFVFFFIAPNIDYYSLFCTFARLRVSAVVWYNRGLPIILMHFFCVTDTDIKFQMWKHSS